MAKELDQKQLDKLVAELKRNPGNSERWYAEKLNIPMGQIGRLLWAAEPIADPSLKIKSTGPAIRDARDKQGLRWPRIAARTGLAESKVKELYEETTGNSASASYTGRGRNHAANGSGSKKTTTATSGRRGQAAAKQATSGRRGAAATSTRGKAAPAAGRSRGTRAAAKSSDPK